MSDELKNILSHSKTSSNNTQELLKYLNNELKHTERHHVEKRMIEDAFEADAMDGLQKIEDKEKILLMVGQLNRNLKRKTVRKTNQRKKYALKPQWGLYFSILILLILIVLIYIYLHSKL